MNYLLDTCSMLWLVNGSPELSAEARRACGETGARLHVSAGGASEIEQKHGRKKLVLPLAPVAWWQKALERHGLIELPITASIAVASAALPRIHNDPFDRVLIATAQEHRLSILTPDPTIKSYPDLKTTW